MSVQILDTKFHMPKHRTELVSRPRLVKRMNEGMRQKLTLISAPAGFGKTTLVTEWASGCNQSIAWLSLDEKDNDPVRFLTYFVVALKSVAPSIGEGVLGILQSSQSLDMDLILTELLNEINAVPNQLTLILDDYHVIDAKSIGEALSFLLEHMPSQMHLVITTREDPDIPLARLRVEGQMTELRSTDLRFTRAEAARFLNKVMKLNLSGTNIDELEARTEGWIASLQLASLALQERISMEGQKGANHFIKSFTGSHFFVLDYLVEEVLGRQSESVQSFLLCTSILDQMSGPLCDAVVFDQYTSGQATLEYLERSNLFLIPLDHERRWYRYHHLFSELLRHQLFQRVASSSEDAALEVAKYHIRASQWYEDNGYDIEAFHHAAAANDAPRAQRLIEGKGVPLYFRGALTPILKWLESVPEATMNEWPSLWTTYAAVLMGTGKTILIEQVLQSAERALQKCNLDDYTRDIIGRIASLRATCALIKNQIETIITQSLRALEYLSLNNVPYRTATTCKLGIAYQSQGNRVEAKRLLTEARSISLTTGDMTTNITATLALGILQVQENQLNKAAQTLKCALQLATSIPFPGVVVAYIGLARIFYQWNDLDTSQQYCLQGIEMAQQIENTEWFVSCQVILARLKLAQKDTDGASDILAQTNNTMIQHGFISRVSEVASEQVLILLRQGNLSAAALLAQTHGLPLSEARVYLAQGDAAAALAVLEPLRLQAEAKNWSDEGLRVLILQAVALHTHGEIDKAVELLAEALTQAEPGGFIRIFIDEGLPMVELLLEAEHRGIMPHYINKLLTFHRSHDQLLINPLSQRELEVLQLIAKGLSNREISEKLFLALDTVKGHNRRIFEKLKVQRRTEALSRARELGIL